MKQIEEAKDKVKKLQQRQKEIDKQLIREQTEVEDFLIDRKIKHKQLNDEKMSRQSNAH